MTGASIVPKIYGTLLLLVRVFTQENGVIEKNFPVLCNRNTPVIPVEVELKLSNSSTRASLREKNKHE